VISNCGTLNRAMASVTSVVCAGPRRAFVHAVRQRRSTICEKKRDHEINPVDKAVSCRRVRVRTDCRQWLKNVSTTVLLLMSLGQGVGSSALISGAAFSGLLSHAEGTGLDRRWLSGGEQRAGCIPGSLFHEWRCGAHITDLQERKGGGELRDRGKRENRNCIGRRKARSRAGRSLLLSACLDSFDGDYLRGGESAPVSARESALETPGKYVHSSGEGAGKASDLQLRALLELLDEESNPASRRSLILILQDLTPFNDLRVVNALCACLLNPKRETIAMRQVLLRVLSAVAVSSSSLEKRVCCMG
jgi:hypothetical protein